MPPPPAAEGQQPCGSDATFVFIVVVISLCLAFVVNSRNDGRCCS